MSMLLPEAASLGSMALSPVWDAGFSLPTCRPRRRTHADAARIDKRVAIRGNYCVGWCGCFCAAMRRWGLEGRRGQHRSAV